MSLQRRGLHDFWTDVLFSSNSSVVHPFLGVAVNAGTNTASVTLNAGYLPYGMLLKSSTTANSGWRYQTSSISGDFFGVQKRKFRGKTMWRTAFTGTTLRIGFHDTNTSADAVDGAYFEVNAAVASAKTAANSVRTAAGTTFTLSLDVVYTFDIDVNAAGTSARFRIYADVSEVPVFDQTITTNIPTGTARTFGCGLVATNSGVAVVDLLSVFYMGFGSGLPEESIQETVVALSGTTPVLSSFNGTIQTWVLSANSTPTDGLADGQSMTLLVDDGTAFAITWPTITWVGGAAPVLKTTGFTIIQLFKVGATLYGTF